MLERNQARTIRLACILLAVPLLLAVVPSIAAAAPAGERISGADRYETAYQIAIRAYSGGTSNVVIATGENWPDALAAGPLTSKVGGPILLSRQGSLPQASADGIIALGADTAYVIGGFGAISADVHHDLSVAGITTIIRYPGTNRYDTAALVAAAIEAWDMNDVDTAYVATGDNFPDALAAGPFAIYLDRPILLTRKDSVPTETQAAISSLALTKTYVLGETAVISDAVMGGLPNPTRLGGSNRYATARIVAAHGLSQTGNDDSHLYIATGEDYPDALGAAVLASGGPFPIIPVQKDAIPQDSLDYINAHSMNITNLYTIGGVNVISPQTEADVKALLP